MRPHVEDFIECRPGCAACCVAPSITGPLPGMPNGKPAGVPCVNLGKDGLCALWGTDDYPSTCRSFQAMRSVCGTTSHEAMVNLRVLEKRTAP
ncbi:MAG: YkgJ family cysteine cluster protein [Planctomycetota bacterium]|jgi:Fe-S-cluster containining protein